MKTDHFLILCLTLLIVGILTLLTFFILFLCNFSSDTTKNISISLLPILSISAITFGLIGLLFNDAHYETQNLSTQTLTNIPPQMAH